jgi:hypothetical protein
LEGHIWHLNISNAISVSQEHRAIFRKCHSRSLPAPPPG